MNTYCRFFSAGISLQLLVILLVLVGGAPASRAEVVDRIVAIVNDDIISLSELNLIMKAYTQQIRSAGYSADREQAMLYQVREELINQLIDQKLAGQEIEKSNISVDEKEIDSFVERFKEANRLTDETMRQGLASQGMTIGEYREKIKEQLLRTKLINRQIKSKIIITQEEIRAYYEAHPEEFQGSTKYHISYILIKPPLFADDDIISTMLDKMSRIRKELESGASYQNVIAQYQSGIFNIEAEELGVFSKEELSTEVFQMIEGLAAGNCTDVMETERGYQMLYLNEIFDLPKKTLAQATPGIQDKLYKEVLDERFDTWIAALRKNAYIKIIQ